MENDGYRRATPKTVIRARAGTQLATAQMDSWFPAFAVMTADGWDALSPTRNQFYEALR